MSALRVSGAAPRIALVLEKLLGAPSPLRIRAWDGTESGPDDAPALIVRSRRAIRRLLWRPDEIGLARAWVAGELDLE
ncbi:MAG TPA: SAM-dependent methyltransferase, partial [Micromonosporaceae bacterium]|nr:SAM-dependent methyltransferase [Micromonosporaceae bacterium]